MLQSSLVYILIASALSAVGNLFLKAAMIKQPITTFALKDILMLATNMGLVVGFLLYAFSVLVWLRAISLCPLSIAQPVFTGFLFLFVIVGSHFFMAEPITFKKVIAVLIIFGGILLLSIE